MTRSRVITALLALLAIINIALVVFTDDDPPDRPTRTVTAPPAGATAAPPAGELDTRNPAELRDDTPADIPPAVLKRADQAEEEIAEDLPPVDAPLPVGGAQNHSCRVDYASRGYGDRHAGAKVMSFKLHYTVSPNVTGWGDVDGVGDYLERVGLSAHVIVDFEGNCEKKVPFEKAAWTQVAFNSTSESVEIIATGKETRAQWLASPLIKQGILASIVGDRLRARGLPRRFVDPAGCTDKLGYTDHNHLECGNDHTDVAPAFPFDVFARQIADEPAAVTLTDRVTCRKIRWWRSHGRPHGKPEQNAVRRRRALDARGVRCLAAGPVRVS